MSRDFDYEKTYMGLPLVDSESSALKVGSKYEFRLWALIRDARKTRGKLLDIGCGAGGFINSLKYHYPEFECYGCDISHAAIQFAKEHCSGEISFDTIKDNKLPFPDNYFDIAILIHVLEHVSNRDEVLQEIYRVLKKGGILHIQVPCEADPFTFTRLFSSIKCGNSLTSKYWGHINPLTTEQVISHVEGCKFIVKRKRYSSFFLSQVLLLFTYFLPKVILDLFLGEERAFKYTDVYTKTKKGGEVGPLVCIKMIWVKLGNFATSIVQYAEFITLGRVGLTALNLHLTCEKV